MIVASGLAVLVGTGILVSEKSLLALCQRHCWLNSLLLAMFGDGGGKIAFAMIWYAVAGMTMYLATRLRRQKKKVE